MSNSSTFVVNEYIINRKRIGKGSFSTIYKGYSTKNNKIYAIKEITIDKKQNKSNVKRELNVLKTLNNPYIVKLHDVIIDTNYNNIYFILDYYPKGDLAKFLNHKPLKEKYCRKYMKQLAEGLEYLLNKDILHRDLKPQNILLTNEYNIKITDFGFAKQITKNTLITTLCGSPMYMAPEIINKQDYDIKSDLWSVGVILYEMAYGYVPFNVGTFLELIKKINSKDIDFTHKKINLSENCLVLMKGLLTKDPTKRIEWEDFFNNKWFLNDEILRTENNLMEISIRNSVSIPNINNYKNDRQFCSFTYESIVENKNLSSSEKIALSYQNTFKNTSNNNSNKTSSDYSNKTSSDYSNKTSSNDSNETEIGDMNFLDSLNDDYSDNETESDYQSADENDEEHTRNYDDSLIEYNNFKNTEDNTYYYKDNYKKSKPININKKNKYKKLNTSEEFEILDASSIKPHSLPVQTKTVTQSLKEYLYSSINLIKQSYNYVSSNKSI